MVHLTVNQSSFPPPPSNRASRRRHADERCEGQGPDPSHSDWPNQPSTHSGEAPPPHRSPLNLRCGQENDAEISHDPIGQAGTPLKSRPRPPGGTAPQLTGQPRDRAGAGLTAEWSVLSVTPAASRPAALNLTCRLAAAVVCHHCLVGGALWLLCPTVRPPARRFPRRASPQCGGLPGSAANMGRRGGASWALEVAVLLLASACFAGEPGRGAWGSPAAGGGRGQGGCGGTLGASAGPAATVGEGRARHCGRGRGARALRSREWGGW